ncbi:MAG: tetratricopeptide repeat protein [Myxococcota bacterium]
MADPKLDFERAVEAHNAGEYERAVVLYDAVLEAVTGPESVPILENRARAHMRLHALDTAVADLDLAISREERPSSLAFRCMLLMQLGRASEAVPSCERAIELEPETAAAHYTLGLLSEKTGDTEAALARYQRVLELDPKQPDAVAAVARLTSSSAGQQYFTYAQQARAAGNAGEAVRGYSLALGAGLPETEQAEAYFWRGVALERLGLPDHALEDLDRAVEARPHLGLVWAARCGVYLRLAKLEPARADCEKAVSLDGKLAEARYLRGLIHERDGNTAEAESAFRRALELQPNHPLAALGLERVAGVSLEASPPPDASSPGE